MPIPLILDSDISPDSWAAILFAALSPNADLLAVTAAGTGEAHGPRGARNVQRLLHLAGRSDVPVGFGPARPLAGDKHFPNLMRFVIDRFMFQRIAAPPQFQPARDAIALITDILRQSDQQVTIAAVGPQTNLATVLTREPALKDKVKGLYIMGGALDTPGNIQGLDRGSNNTTAEWNFYCDPLAAQKVFESGVPVFLVPLDATNQVPVSEAFKQGLAAINNPPARFYSKVLHLLTGALGQRDTFYLWDPITTACALDPGLAVFTKRKVAMVTDPGDEWGRVRETPDGVEIHVARKIDAGRFEEKLLNAFGLQYL